MMRLVVFLSSCLLSTMAQTPVKEIELTREDLGPKPECFDDLDVLDRWVETKEFLTETFILCPNTYFQVGSQTGPNEPCCKDGSAPLTLRQNSRYMCGKDGKSSNNCILKGGMFQAISSAGTFGGEKKLNVRLEGLTFEDGGNSGVLLAAAGDVTFIDCVFRKHENTGAVSVLFFPTKSRRMDEIAAMEHRRQVGHLMTYYTELLENPEQLQAIRNENRHLDEENEERQAVYMDSCLFSFNRPGDRRSAGTNFGVIGVETESNDLFLKNCLFEHNDFGDPETMVDSYAIEVKAGSTISMQDTCFIHNDFAGLGTVKIAREEDMESFARNAGTFEEHTVCNFVSIGAGEDVDVQCIPYDTNECSRKLGYLGASAASLSHRLILSVVVAVLGLVL